MRYRLFLAAVAALLVAAVSAVASSDAVPSAVTYQGKLTNSAGQPVADGEYDVQFKLYDVQTSGTAFKTLMRQKVQAAGGFFTTQMTPLAAADIAGKTDVWVEVIVEATTLSPRVKLVSAPFALRASTFALPFSGTVASSSPAFALTNTIGSAAAFGGTVEMTGFKMATGAGAGKVLASDANGIGTWQVASGSVPCWSLTGNSGTNPSVNFVGTTQNEPLEFRVNSQRALRLENAFDADSASANVIGGYGGNSATSGVVGGTIGGGGAYYQGNAAPNKVTDSYSTVAGGLYNRAGNDNSDVTDANYATVAGGAFDIASARYAAVGGGYFNQATAESSVVAGGTTNSASGLYSAVPGGAMNSASGSYSFAAGRRAKAAKQGAFVWADSTNADFSSTASNQFLIRASGGVGIGTDSPLTPLDVNGIVRSGSGGFQFPDATVQTTAAAATLALPYSGSSGTSLAAFQVTNTGAGSAGSFSISSGTNATSALSGGTLGTGSGVFGLSTGSGNGVYGYSTGTGHAGKFVIDNTSSAGTALSASTSGSGNAGKFLISNVSSTHDALYASTSGSGSAIRAASSGSDATLYASNAGTGRAATFSADSPSSADYAVCVSTAGSGPALYAQAGSGTNAAVFRGNVLLQDKATGNTLVELGGGLDYAEGFRVAGSKARPGTVLVIDPKHPGKLAVSSGAYDTRVAGIVAGANNLSSGVRLGVGQFDHNVALAGRVYCNVDATKQGIEPGDLLTTSSTPGYAMKATDRARRQGAILGKAMERLAKGRKGQILVLVTLQ